jgi:hypothetical protein
MSELLAMSIAHASPLDTAPLCGGREFLTRADRTERCRLLADEGFLVARVVPVFDSSDETDSRPGMSGPLRRGELRQALEGAVEISLALRGALPPSVDVDADIELMARDQLFRVRTLGAQGLCIVLPELSRLAIDGRLEDLDSATLCSWKELSESEPVVILFDIGDRDLELLAPQLLCEAFTEDTDHPPSWPDDERALDEEAALLPDAEEADDSLDPMAGTFAIASADSVALQSEADGHQRWHDDLSAIELDAPSTGAASLGTTTASSRSVMRRDPLEGIDVNDEPAVELDAQPTLPYGPGAASLTDLGGLGTRNVFDDDDALDIGLESMRSAIDSSPLDCFPAGSAPAQQSLFTAAPPRPPIMTRATCERLVSELEAAHGPKPVSTIEELFRNNYAPLLDASCRGLDDAAADAAIKIWRASFEKSYGDGFRTLKLTGKRPNMVLDVPELAARQARLNGARAVQLLLVDSMRYDLGQRVVGKLHERIGDRAVCVDEALLWSALPTITPTQLRLLARGPRGLRESAPQSERRDPIIHRGKSVTTLRRVRIGQRDLVKLDVVEARLREAGPNFDDRMNDLSVEVADVIARFSESLAPRTLLYVFGDHGFTMERDGNGTSPASQGDATPEEVLLGGYAWLVGDVH